MVDTTVEKPLKFKYRPKMPVTTPEMLNITKKWPVAALEKVVTTL